MARCPRCKHVLGPEDCDQPGDVCLECNVRSTAIVNPHEIAARSKKIIKLVETIDREALRQGIDPFDSAGRVQLATIAWEDAHWAKVAELAGVNMPSPITRDSVRQIYIDRARRKPLERAS